MTPRRGVEPPASIDPALASYYEGVVIEQMASVAASLEKNLAAMERRLRVKVETAELAEMSGQLTMVSRRLTKYRALAALAGTLAGTMFAMFATAWSQYRDTADLAETAAERTAEKVAVDVVEAKTAPAAVQSTIADVRIATVEARQAELEQKVDTILDGINALRQQRGQR